MHPLGRVASWIMRLFVAIELSDAVRSALRAAQAALRPQCDGVRWVPPEQLHLTVKFLGEVGDADVPGVCAAVQRAAAASQALAMSVPECGCFPERGPVRIVWVATEEPSGSLAGCVEATERELESLGFARETRAFSPHITIGRVREDRSRGAIRAAVEKFHLADAEAVEQEVSSLTLMSSVLSPKGPTYSVVSRAKLGA